MTKHDDEIIIRAHDGTPAEYDDVLHALCDLFDIEPIDPDNDGHATTWTFRPKRPPEYDN